MQQVRYVRLTSWFLLLFFPLVMNAQPAQAALQAQGAVMVNGKGIANNAAIFAGDRIQTGANSLATLTSQGMMVQLQPNTNAIFSEHALDLGCGSATVVTSVGTMLRVQGITVTPAAQNATKIEVSQENGMVKVTARDNWAVVNDGRIRQTLAPGQSATFSRPGATCDIVTHSVSQATTKYYLPAAAAVGGLWVITYCASNGWCSESSPAAP